MAPSDSVPLELIRDRGTKRRVRTVVFGQLLVERPHKTDNAADQYSRSSSSLCCGRGVGGDLSLLPRTHTHTHTMEGGQLGFGFYLPSALTHTLTLRAPLTCKKQSDRKPEDLAALKLYCTGSMDGTPRQKLFARVLYSTVVSFYLCSHALPACRLSSRALGLRKGNVD